MEGRATLQSLGLRRCHSQLPFATTLQEPSRLYRHRPTGQVCIRYRQHDQATRSCRESS
jgi:hypothetical protein